MPPPKSGRQLILERLYKAMNLSTTADLQRAAMFLERAQEIRNGCRNQRNTSRSNQRTAWKKRVDGSITW
jgi:hypothetical protein